MVTNTNLNNYFNYYHNSYYFISNCHIMGYFQIIIKDFQIIGYFQIIVKDFQIVVKDFQIINIVNL